MANKDEKSTVQQDQTQSTVAPQGASATQGGSSSDVIPGDKNTEGLTYAQLEEMVKNDPQYIDASLIDPYDDKYSDIYTSTFDELKRREIDEYLKGVKGLEHKGGQPLTNNAMAAFLSLYGLEHDPVYGIKQYDLDDKNTPDIPLTGGVVDSRGSHYPGSILAPMMYDEDKGRAVMRYSNSQKELPVYLYRGKRKNKDGKWVPYYNTFEFNPISGKYNLTEIEGRLKLPKGYATLNFMGSDKLYDDAKKTARDNIFKKNTDNIRNRIFSERIGNLPAEVAPLEIESSSMTEPIRRVEPTETEAFLNKLANRQNRILKAKEKQDAQTSVNEQL